MKQHATKIGYLFLSALLFFSGCSDVDNELEFKARGTLIAFSETAHVTKEEAIAAVSELSIQGTAQYGVTLYSITYRTDYDGKQIDSKGLLMVPDGVTTVYLIAYFHGTQLPVKLLDFYDSKNETPSNYRGGKDHFGETRNMGLTWASAGYAVFMPDYIGFGSTLEKEHPYLNFPEMFQSNIDGLLAVKKFLSDKGLSYDSRLFLSGWSQGGGACLSAHSYIEQQYSGEFTVVASSSLAGPHNFERFFDDLISKKDKELNISNIFSWAVYGLNRFSNLKRPTDQLYAYPVYDQFAAIFPPSKVPSEIFNGYFLSKIIDGSDQPFRDVLEANTFAFGWQPTGKVFLHHGNADDVVYYYNSVDAYDGLTAAGGDAKLYTYPGGTHSSELGNFISNTLLDFNTLK